MANSDSTLDPIIQKLIDIMRRLPETEQKQFVKLGWRLKNHDPKVLRLIEMFEKKDISRGQFLAAM